MPQISPSMPRWAHPLLIAAAVYNVVWGTFFVLFPLLPFQWASLPAPNYPAIVQCLGMVIGVYGVGYYLAAKDPVTRWPLIFVGLLGKVLGPIGFVYAASMGEFPWRAGWTIVTNDLVWWLPFISILFHVIRVRDEKQAEEDGLSLEIVLRETITPQGESLFEISQKQGMLVVCLRHSGCTFCREALADLSHQKDAILKANVRVIVVHMGDQIDSEQMAKQYHLEDLTFVSDPSRRIYRALDLRLGTLSQLLGPKTFWRALFGDTRFLGGPVFQYGFGQFKGNGLQMPGTFLIRDGQIITAYRNQSPADRPDYLDVSTCGISNLAK